MINGGMTTMPPQDKTQQKAIKLKAALKIWKAADKEIRGFDKELQDLLKESKRLMKSQ
jgi:hypothetical protein